MSDGTIRIRCASCGIKLRVKAKAHRLFCPSCREPIVVGSPDLPVETKALAIVATPIAAVPPLKTNPVVTTTAPQPAFSLTPAGFGALAGIVGLTMLWTVLPNLGPIPVAGVVVLAAMGFFIVALGCRMQARTLSTHLGPDHPAVTRPLRRNRTIHAVGRGCVGAATILLILKTYVPPAGTRLLTLWEMSAPPPTAVSRIQAVIEPTPKPSVAVAPAPLDPFDEKVWAEADFVLVNPGHVANAVQRTESDGKSTYRLLESVGDDARVERAKKVAYESGTSIIAENPALARLVRNRTEPGAEIAEEAARQIDTLWRPRSYTVPGSRLVIFNDLRNRRRRVGFVESPDGAKKDGGAIDPLLAPPSPRFTFFDLLSARDDGANRTPSPLRSESVPTELVQPGTWRIDPTDSELRAGVDFLDLCMLQVARRLESKEPQHTLVYVDEVWFEPRRHLGELKLESKNAKGFEAAILQFEDAAPPMKLSEILLQCLLLPEDSSNKTPSRAQLDREDESQRVSTQIRRLRDIEGQADRLGSEIRTRLTRVGIPLAARNPIGLIRNGQQAREGVPDFEKAKVRNFLGASHLLMTEIRQPERTGRYEVSMRLIDAKGQIVWEEIGDRSDTSEQALELANSPYLLNTGRLVLLDFAGKSRRPAAPANLESLKGGLPLNLSPIKLEAPPDDAAMNRSPGSVPNPPYASRAQRNRRPAVRMEVPDPGLPDGLFTRLLYVENVADLDGKGAGALRIRDLFSQTVESLDRSYVSSWKIVNGPTDVPEAHMLRYVAWHMSKSILPLAGRVTKVADSSVELSISRRDGVNPGDRLTVIRSAEATEKDRTVEMVLPCEFIVTEVHDGGSRAYSERSQGVEPKPGDIVHRKSPKKIVVAVPRPTVDVTNVEPQMLNGTSRGELEIYIGNTAKELANTLESALLSLKISIVERERLDGVLAEQRTRDVDPQRAAQLGRLVGATHVILGTVFPDVTRTYRPPATLRIVEVETGLVTSRIEFQVPPNWKP